MRNLFMLMDFNTTLECLSVALLTDVMFDLKILKRVKN